MIRSLYSGVSGMRNHQVRMDVIGNNIANVNTTGFKSSRANFQDVFSQTLRMASPSEEGRYGSINPAQVGLGMTIAGISLNIGQGSLQYTGRTLDVAIEGNGFFVIRKDLEIPIEESCFLSREGNFTMDTNGYLVNYNGYFVCNAEGEPIRLSEAPESIETIAITDTGQILINGDAIDQQIGLAVLPNPEGMEKVGQNLYRATEASGGKPEGENGLDSEYILPAGKADTAVENTRFASGYLEMSNVDLTDEMTGMITTHRGYQANARVITVSDSLLQELVDLKR